MGKMVGLENCIRMLNTNLNGKMAFPSIENFDTLADFINHVVSLGRIYIGRINAPSFLPLGSWMRCWCVLQNNPGGKYGVAGQMIVADSDKVYFGYINGITDFTVKWYAPVLKTIGDIKVTTLGSSVSGMSFQYYKKGNVLTVYVSGTLSVDIAPWASIKSTVTLPAVYRPSINVYGTTSYPGMDVIMRVGIDGYIYIQRASNTSGGKGNWFGFNASYGVDY